MFPGALDIPNFISFNIGATLLYYALSGIGFFASALFNQSKHSLALGGGIPVAFLLIKMLTGVGNQLSGLKNLTLLTLFDPSEIIAGSSVLPAYSALIGVSLIL
jgi:ABC-2 type transport system permease protein